MLVRTAAEEERRERRVAAVLGQVEERVASGSGGGLEVGGGRVRE